MLTIATDVIALDVLPGLGGTISSLTRRSDGAEICWNPPWDLRPPGTPVLPGTPEAVALSRDPGGWQTIFPNGGESVSVHGVEWGFDGEARTCTMDWEFTGSSLMLTTRLARAPFELSKIISIRDHEVTVGETVRNVGRERVEVIWGSRLTLGADLLGSDTVLDASATVVHPDPKASPGTSYDELTPWPRGHGRVAMINLRTLPAADAGETRIAYLDDFTRPWLEVRRPSRDLAIELEWDGRTWPHVWYTVEAGGGHGFPWYRAGYFLRLAPCTSWPAHGVHEARRVSDSTMWISPGSSKTSYLTLRFTPATRQVGSQGETPRPRGDIGLATPGTLEKRPQERPERPT